MKLLKHAVISGVIFCETGLRIGGSNDDIEIGGMDYCGPFGQDKYFSNLRYQRGPLSLRFYCYYYVIFFSPPWLWAVWTTRTRCPSPVVNLIGLSTGRHCPQPVSPDSVSQLSNMPQPVSCRPGTDEASRCCKNSYTC